MLSRLAPDLRILRFAIMRRRLDALHTIDVDALDHAEEWMRQHSLLWTDTPAIHGAHYIRRRTSVPRENETAVEYYFSATVFRRLYFWRGSTHAK